MSWNFLNFGPAILLAFFAIACGGDGPAIDGGRTDGSLTVGAQSGGARPMARPTPRSQRLPRCSPARRSAGPPIVPINGSVRATFSEPMERASLSASTFALTTSTPAMSVPGNVVYSGVTAVFWPATQLEADTTYTATPSSARSSSSSSTGS